jgi:hypothetical protein
MPTILTMSQAAVAILYGFGFFVTIVQAIRIQTIAALATYTESKPIIQWSIVEVNTGVIVACVPALSPLLKSFGRKISSNSRSGAYGAKSGGTAYGQSQRSAAATASRTPARKSRVLASSRDDDDDDEIELCEMKNGWVARSHSTRVRTVGGIDDGDSDGRSRTSSPYDPQQQHITVVHEYTVEHADAR